MFAEKLLLWYQEHGRVMPWRGISNPYYIWLSEVILQQTRIEQGRSYYERFVTEYPTVEHLARASEEQVLKSWQGLGYYSRARNLHAAAKYVAEELGGRFPDTYEGLLALKGVGRYTAAAIASFAYRLPHPVIDGNVYRLTARLYGIYTPIGTEQAYREFEELLTHLIDRERPDLFNHAMMDFGSIYCKPTGSDCEGCIFRLECVAHREGKVSVLPVKRLKSQPTERYFYYVDVRWGSHVVVHQREAGDIWQGLYELPLHETPATIKEGELEKELSEVMRGWFGAAPDSMVVGEQLTHQLTHRTIKAQFVKANYEHKPPKLPEKMQELEWGELKYLPVSRLIDKYLSKL